MVVEAGINGVEVYGEVFPGASINANISTGASIEANVIASGPRGPKGDPGTTDYTELYNRPTIESVELVGDRDITDFGISFADSYDIRQLFR